MNPFQQRFAVACLFAGTFAMTTNLATARLMVDTAKRAGIVLGVVSQHRFDDSSLFLKKAIGDGRLGISHAVFSPRAAARDRLLPFP